MVTWLVLLALVGSVFHLHSRLRQLEERLDDLQPAGADASWSEFTIAAEPDQPAAEDTTETAGPRPPATILYAEPRPLEPISEPNEAADPAEPGAARWNIGFGFEELFGRRLPIWAGGITLAVAGVLIVKLSIESGLLKPLVRVIAGLLFGSTLIAGAELALRFEERVRNPRVRQALSGAGLASLYASILVAVDLYHLI